MKYFIFLMFLFSAGPGFAQKTFFLTTSAGWDVNYNKLESDKPLPKGMIQHSRFSGFSSAWGVEYKVNPHWGIHAQIKTAGIKMGIKSTAFVLYDTLDNSYKTNYGNGGGSSTRNAPAHYQLGGTYYSNPVKTSKFSWLLGGGVAYLVTRYKFPEDYVGMNSGIGVNDAYNCKINKIYGKSFDIEMAEEFSRNGILLNIHAGIDFHFAPKHHFLLTLQHNEGLRRIRQFKSVKFNYVDLTPASDTAEAFESIMYAKGSYSALQLGYKYALFNSK